MITLTDRAASQINGLLESQGNLDARLRVFVAGGGCSGFQYGMSLEEAPMEGDQEFEAGQRDRHAPLQVAPDQRRERELVTVQRRANERLVRRVFLDAFVGDR